MKKYYALCLLLMLLVAFKQDDPKSIHKMGKFMLPKGVTAQDYLPNTLIVKFKNSTSDKQVNSIASAAKKQLTISGTIITDLNPLFPTTSSGKQTQSLSKSTVPDLNDIYIAHYEGKQDIAAVINTLLQDEQIAYVEPSYVYHTSFTPNDPFLGSQYYLAQVKAPQAWDIIKNSSNVIIAIVDSGSDLQHQDLMANFYLNVADPINGIDDDGDGYVDNYYGWDLVGNSATTMVQDNDPDVKYDANDHGVHVSGIASAVSNNGVGVASIAFNAKLMIVKAGADDNATSIYKGYEGIKYAADHGAHIINCSWGGPGGGQFGQEMIDYAVAKGCLVVAAAGNNGNDVPGFPASYNGVLSVANVDGADVKSPPSSYGYSVDISAPGSGIYNTLNGNRYGSYSGTSMASPMVASAAALIKAKYPSYTGLQIGELLRATADPIDNLNSSIYAGKLGKGRLNVYNALTQTPASVRYQKIAITDQTNGSRAAGSDLTLTLDLKNFLAPVSGLNVNISSSSPYVQVVDQNISAGNLATLESKTNIGPIKVKVLANSPQNQQVALKLTYTGNAGSYVDSEQFNITVALDYLNVTVNKVSTTLSSNGRVGFSKAEADGGLGFIYKDEGMLYEASLLIGRSATQVSNNARANADYSEDFVKQISAQQISNSQAAFEGQSTFTDQASANAIGLKVKSTILAYATAPDDKYVIVNYEITNTTNATLSGIYTGLFTDWDLDESAANATKYDEVTRTAYAYAKKNAGYPYAGICLLTNTAPAAYYPMSYQLADDPLSDNQFTIAEKYKTLSSGIKAVGLGYDSINGYDIMFTIGSGPYVIPANGSIKVAYAFLGGDNLTELLNNGAAAQVKYGSGGSIIPIDPATLTFTLKQNYPNPTQVNTTTIPFILDEKAATTLTISNIQGKVLKTLVNQTLDAGYYSIPVDLSTIGAGVYMYRLTSGTHEKTLKMIIVK